MRACNYCISPHTPIVGSKTIRRFITHNPGVHLDPPICSSCWLGLKKKIPAISLIKTDNEVELVGLLNKVVENCNSACRSGSIEQLEQIFRDIDYFSMPLKSAEHEFLQAADRAAALGRKVENLNRAFENAKDVIRTTFNTGYKTCRKLASRHISSSSVRQRIFERDGFKCKSCGSTSFLTIDHIVAVFRGGGNDDENLQCLCLSCNCSKGTVKQERWSMNKNAASKLGEINVR